jgi:hypothetical protein
MSGGKINGFNGHRKRHSIARPIIPFLDGLIKHPFEVNVGCGRIVPCNFKPVEPVEVRGYNLEGKHCMCLRVYKEGMYQEVYVFCNKARFPEIMGYITRYCELAN